MYLVYFFLWSVLFNVFYLGNLCLLQSHKDSLLYFKLEALIILSVITSVYLELIFYSER